MRGKIIAMRLAALALAGCASFSQAAGTEARSN
jgi:hypothetical protein